MAGACRLPFPWNGCKNGTDFCFKRGGPYSRYTKELNGTYHNFHLDHFFDEQVTKMDVKVFDTQSEGVLNHLQYRRPHSRASLSARTKKGIYTASHFSTVYEALERKGLVMAIELPPVYHKPYLETDHEWIDLVRLYDNVRYTMAQSGNGDSVSLNLSTQGHQLSKIMFKDILPVTDHMKGDVNKLKLQNEINEKLSPKYALDSTSKYQSLPSFSTDMSELFLAAMIEREDDSWDLHLTNFLVSHSIIESNKEENDVLNVRNDREALSNWSRAITAFQSAQYLPDGMRAGPHFFCKISNANGEKAYTVKGEYQYINYFS